LISYTSANWKSRKKTDKFLDTYDSTKLNQEDINELNRLVGSNEIETVIKNLPTKKSRPDGLTAKSYQTFKEELTSMLLKLFQKHKGKE
jgi:RNase H-fold protein (predicted Holliday junction resolvase)